MSRWSWLGALLELAWREWRQERRRARNAQVARDAWANTPVPVRGCPKCREIAYTPRQTHCNKCGAQL